MNGAALRLQITSNSSANLPPFNFAVSTFFSAEKVSIIRAPASCALLLRSPRKPQSTADSTTLKAELKAAQDPLAGDLHSRIASPSVSGEPIYELPFYYPWSLKLARTDRQ